MRTAIDSTKRDQCSPSPAFLGSPTQGYSEAQHWKRIELTGQESSAFLGSPTQNYVVPSGRLQITAVADGVRRILLRIGAVRTNRTTQAPAASVRPRTTQQN